MSLALPFPFSLCFKNEEHRLSLGLFSVVACHQPGPILSQRVEVCRRKAKLSLKWLWHERMRLVIVSGSW